MKPDKFLEILKEQRLVVVVRGSSIEQAFNTIVACYEGGVRLIEITFTVPKAEKLIAMVVEKFKNTDMIVGAGTVLDIKTAELALSSGAEYIVSPNLSLEVQAYCKKLNVAYTPGILTPTEAVLAMQGGASVLKLFPGDIAKPNGLKALKGPFPNIEIMPTGGVSFENLEDWFKAGAVAVGAGSNLTAKALQNDFAGVRQDAQMWVNKISTIK